METQGRAGTVLSSGFSSAPCYFVNGFVNTAISPKPEGMRDIGLVQQAQEYDWNIIKYFIKSYTSSFLKETF